MPLYRTSGNDMAQLANHAMGSASNTMASQTRQTTTVRKKEGNFWDDLYKGARALEGIAGAVNSTVGMVDKGIDLYDKVKVKGAYDDIAKAYADGGLEAIQNNPGLRGYHHSVALGNFMKDRANTEKGQFEMMRKAREAAQLAYGDYSNNARLALKQFDSGNMEAFGNTFMNMSAMDPQPTKFLPDGKGNFQEMFRSDESGGWVPTGKVLTPQQARDGIAGVLNGEQMVLSGVTMQPTPYNEAWNNARAAQFVRTSLGNAALRADPANYKPLYKNGQLAGYYVAQNPISKKDGTSAWGEDQQLQVFNTKGEALGAFNGYDEVLKMGFTAMAPQKAGRGGRSGSGKTSVKAAAAQDEEALLQGGLSFGE